MVISRREMEHNLVEQIPRHQCLIYSGAPSAQLPGLALVIRKYLAANYRCLYLNSPPMVAGIRLYLSASGLDADEAVKQGRLILSSSRDHLVDGAFDPQRLIAGFNEIFDRAIRDGYAGLWGSGDMAWELGPERDFHKLVEYERALEAFFQAHPAVSGVCQYHEDVLPAGAVQDGFAVHPGLYINQTLSRMNPRYLAAAE